MSEENTAQERIRTLSLASAISIVGHPFVLLPLTVMITTLRNSPAERAFSVGAGTVLSIVLPLLVVIRRNVRAGRWFNHDISDRSQRHGFYPIALGITACAVLIFFSLNFPRPILTGTIVSFALLLAAMFVNHWLKVSLHTIFASYCALILASVDFRIGILFIAFAALIGWSRIALARHNLIEVLSGMLLGATAGIILLWLFGLF